jgi:hypothetical protein
MNTTTTTTRIGKIAVAYNQTNGGSMMEIGDGWTMILRVVVPGGTVPVD